VITDSRHGKAQIIDVTPGRIRDALDKGRITIVAGFQGVAQDTKDVTTLGRGGSDTTAVALAEPLPLFEGVFLWPDVHALVAARHAAVPTSASARARKSTTANLTAPGRLPGGLPLHCFTPPDCFTPPASGLKELFARGPRRPEVRWLVRRRR
jgi:hypothetical protein